MYVYGASQRIDSINNLILSILSICVLKMPCQVAPLGGGSGTQYTISSGRTICQASPTSRRTMFWAQWCSCSRIAFGETLAFENCQSLTLPLSCHADPHPISFIALRTKQICGVSPWPENHHPSKSWQLVDCKHILGNGFTVDAPRVKNDMAVLEVEVTAVGLTFEGDGSHLEIPWGDGMVPTDGVTCYILQPHLSILQGCGFVQKWGCTNSCKVIVSWFMKCHETVGLEGQIHRFMTMIPVIMALYTHFVDPFRWWYTKSTIGLLWTMLWTMDYVFLTPIFTSP